MIYDGCTIQLKMNQGAIACACVSASAIACVLCAVRIQMLLRIIFNECKLFDSIVVFEKLYFI